MTAPIVVVDRDELRALIRDELRDAFAELRAKLRDDAHDKLVDVEHAAKLVGTTPGALRKRLERGHVRAVRQGRRVLVRVGDLLGERDGRDAAE